MAADPDGRPVIALGASDLSVLALDGIPEIRPGDDLPALLADALGRLGDRLA